VVLVLRGERQPATIDERPVQLAGQVVWSLPQPGGTYQVGVQLEPYGSSGTQNPPEALERIIELEARHLRT